MLFAVVWCQIIFMLFAYPFSAANLCFIEIQRMNELLHDTDITPYLLHDDIDDDGNAFVERSKPGSLLSSNSSFWFIFGFVLNHFPILYFLTKTAAVVAFFSGAISNATGLDHDDNSQIIGDTGYGTLC